MQFLSCDTTLCGLQPVKFACFAAQPEFPNMQIEASLDIFWDVMLLQLSFCLDGMILRSLQLPT